MFNHSLAQSLNLASPRLALSPSRPFPASPFLLPRSLFPERLVSDLVSCMAQFSPEEESCRPPHKKQRQTPHSLRIPLPLTPDPFHSGFRQSLSILTSVAPVVSL